MSGCGLGTCIPVTPNDVFQHEKQFCKIFLRNSHKSRHFSNTCLETCPSGLRLAKESRQSAFQKVPPDGHRMLGQTQKWVMNGSKGAQRQRKINLTLDLQHSNFPRSRSSFQSGIQNLSQGHGSPTPKGLELRTQCSLLLPVHLGEHCKRQLRIQPLAFQKFYNCNIETNY